MHNPLKKSFVAILAFVATLAPVVFAQDAKSPPLIEVEKVDFTTGKVPHFDQKLNWGWTEVRFRAKPYGQYPQDTFLNDVKVTLTLVYPKSLASISGERAKGSAAQRAAEIDAASENAGNSAKFSYYRATVSLVGLKVDNKSRYLRFFVPGEIVDREIRGGGNGAKSWTGSAKPLVYWVSFTCNGEEVPLYNKDGKLMFRNAIGGTESYANNMAKSTFEKFQSEASGSVSDTKGLLIPQTYMPYEVWPTKDSPAILREEIQQ